MRNCVIHADPHASPTRECCARHASRPRSTSRGRSCSRVGDPRKTCYRDYNLGSTLLLSEADREALQRAATPDTEDLSLPTGRLAALRRELNLRERMHMDPSIVHETKKRSDENYSSIMRLQNECDQLRSAFSTMADALAEEERFQHIREARNQAAVRLVIRQEVQRAVDLAVRDLETSNEVKAESADVKALRHQVRRLESQLEDERTSRQTEIASLKAETAALARMVHRSEVAESGTVTDLYRLHEPAFQARLKAELLTSTDHMKSLIAQAERRSDGRTTEVECRLEREVASVQAMLERGLRDVRERVNAVSLGTRRAVEAVCSATQVAAPVLDLP